MSDAATLGPTGATPLAVPGQPAAGRSEHAVDQALWRELQQGDDTAFAAAFLTLACRAIPGAVSGALVMRNTGTALKLIGTWPAGTNVSASLSTALAAAAEGGRGVVQPHAQGPNTSLALPILMDGTVVAVAGVDATLGQQGRDPRTAMRQLQWAAAWVRDRVRGASMAADAARGARTEIASDLLAAILDQPSATAALRAAATELASAMACERVSVGFVRRGRCRMASVSHSAAFGKRMAVTSAIEAAMDEAIDQLALVMSPAPDDAVLVTAAHDRLARLHDPATVLTVPLLSRDVAVGAVTLERPESQPFSARDVALAEAVAAMLGPALTDKRRADRWLVLRAADSAVAGFGSLFGAGHLGRKLGALVTVALLASAWFVRAEYVVYAHARVAGTVQRAITAPFDGFVREAPARAGDEVREGALLAALQDRDLVLERMRWVTEREVHRGEYDQAFSAGKRADTVRLQSQIEQAESRIRLADEQLARTRLVAPFDGLVVSGDMTQSIGAPVRRGDVLFEMAPLDDYRVELMVPESQIADLREGDRGALLVAALPDVALPITLRRVTPVADAKDGAMVFRADASLDTPPGPRLRPGMEGLAKIDAGRARLIWIWTRSFQHWLRLAVWSWLP